MSKSQASRGELGRRQESGNMYVGYVGYVGNVGIGDSFRVTGRQGKFLMQLHSNSTRDI